MKHTAILIAITASLPLVHGEIITTVSANGLYFDGFAPNFGCTSATSCDVNAPSDTYHYAAGEYSADAVYGSLDVHSRSAAYIHSELSGRATASFSDVIVFDNGVGQGTVSFLIEAWGRELGDSCPDYLYGCFPAIEFDLGGQPMPLEKFTSQTVQQVDYTFTYGQPFALLARTTAYSSALGHEFGEQFAHFRLDSMEVKQSGVAVVSGFAMLSAPSFVSVEVPEPSVLRMMIGVIILGLFIWLKSE